MPAFEQLAGNHDKSTEARIIDTTEVPTLKMNENDFNLDEENAPIALKLSDFNYVAAQPEFENDLYYGEDGEVFNLSNYDLSGAVFVDSGYDDYSENSTSAVPENVTISNGRLVALSIFTIIFLLGIVGNALVIGTTARFGSMRKVVTYMYLVNLSVANLIYLVVCLPTVTASYILVDWPFGQMFCQMENYIMSISMAVSVLTIVATGLDRYLAIVYPVQSKNYRTMGKTLIVIASIWVLSLLLMIPRINLYHVDRVYHLVGMTKLCVRVASTNTLKSDTAITCLLLYVLPQLVLVFCHVRIGQTIWRGGRIGLRENRPFHGGLFGIRERRRIAKIVIAITIVFGIGWLPVHLYHLVEDFDYGNILFGEVLDRGTVALFFSFGANALNPLIYCVISGTYRKHITNTVMCRKTTLVIRTATERGREETSYRRTAPILQPRPALILPSPPRNRTELSRHLLEPHSSDTFTTTMTSPVSVEELSGIRVSDIDQISTSSLVKSVLASPPYLKNKDMTSYSLLKTMSPSLILTDLEVSNDEENKSDIKSTEQNNCINISKCSENNDNYIQQINTPVYSSKTNTRGVLTKLASIDNRYHDKLSEELREKQSRSYTLCQDERTRQYRSHRKLHVKFPHSRKQNAATELFHPSQLLPSASFPSSASSSTFLNPIESSDTKERYQLQTRLTKQANILSSNLQQPKKQKLIQIKSFSTNGSDSSDSNNSNSSFQNYHQTSDDLNKQAHYELSCISTNTATSEQCTDVSNSLLLSQCKDRIPQISSSDYNEGEVPGQSVCIGGDVDESNSGVLSKLTIRPLRQNSYHAKTITTATKQPNEKNKYNVKK